MRDRLREFRPDIVHCHNTFPLISPSIYFACEKERVPVVQSLHNPRLMCPAACLSRNSQICERCVGKNFAWPGVVRGCYRGSRLQTAAVASMLSIHRALKTWQTKVDAYIVFTDFYRRKFIEAGLPADRLFVKPHFLHPEPPPLRVSTREYALFVGRLNEEKGLKVFTRILAEIRRYSTEDTRRRSPMPHLREWTAANPASNVELVGRLPKKHLQGLMRNARFSSGPHRVTTKRSAWWPWKLFRWACRC